jgi:hypothetical protein
MWNKKYKNKKKKLKKIRYKSQHFKSINTILKNKNLYKEMMIITDDGTFGFGIRLVGRETLFCFVYKAHLLHNV